MSDLAYRRVAGGPDPIRDVLLVPRAGQAAIWRSHGAMVGEFTALPAAIARIRDAQAAAEAVQPPGAASALPADRLAEHLTLDGASLSVIAGSEVDGPWGALLAACRAAVDDPAGPGEPVAAVALVAELPNRVRLEQRGSSAIELGFGALSVAVRWTQDGLETGYAGARIEDGVVAADRGWSKTITLDPAPPTMPVGTPVVTASFSVNDRGVWIPARLELAGSGPPGDAEPRGRRPRVSR